MKVFLPRYISHCVVFILLLIQKPVSAQGNKYEPGYIITMTGDSIAGFILVPAHSVTTAMCSFKQSPDGDVKAYSSADIKAYGIGTKKRYVAYVVTTGKTNEKVFLNTLVKGKVSLHYYNERYFAESANGIQELVTTTSNVTRQGKVYKQELPVYKGVLQSAMNDCASIHESLRGATLKKHDLTDLFVKYHECIGRPATVYESGAGKLKVAVGLALSGQSTAFDLQSGGNPSLLFLDDNDAMKDFTFAPTFITEFYASEGKGRFRIRTGLSYFTAKYNFYDQGFTGTLDHSLTIDMARLELPVMVKYYPFKKVSIYISAGMGFNTVVKWKQTNTTIVPPSTIISEGSDLENNNFFTNPMAGLGFDFPVGRRKLFIEAILAQSQSVLSSSTNQTSKLNSVTFTTGIVF